MTGDTVWSFFTGDELYISPSYADNKIYVVTSQRDIFILDTANKGAKLATYTTPSSSWSSPTIANDRLFIGCNDWNLYCFSNVINAQKPSPTSTVIIDISPGTDMTIALAIVAALIIIAIVVAGYMIRKRRNKPQSTIESNKV